MTAQPTGPEPRPGTVFDAAAPGHVWLVPPAPTGPRAAAVSPYDGVLTPGMPRARGAGQRITKRMVDVVLSAMLLLLLAPVLLLVALLVRCTSRGPVLYRQVRIGKDGEPILVRKFRSMRQGADREVDRLAELNDVDGGHLFKMRRDPRVTRVGHWLRKFSLDELPQLVNVLSGTMSLVGPRPALPDEVAGYSQDVARRLTVRPGLTGLWQVSGRSDLSWRQAVSLDLYYVEHWSLWLDLRILVRTVPAVLLARGAY